MIGYKLDNIELSQDELELAYSLGIEDFITIEDSPDTDKLIEEFEGGTL